MPLTPLLATLGAGAINVTICDWGPTRQFSAPRGRACSRFANGSYLTICCQYFIRMMCLARVASLVAVYSMHVELACIALRSVPLDRALDLSYYTDCRCSKFEWRQRVSLYHPGRRTGLLYCPCARAGASSVHGAANLPQPLRRCSCFPIPRHNNNELLCMSLCTFAAGWSPGEVCVTRAPDPAWIQVQ